MIKKIQLSSDNYADLTYVTNAKRDLMIIFPGGGYERTSTRESEPVAKVFREHGFHTLVYYYRESKILYPDTTIEVYDLLTKVKKEKNIGRIFLIGFSAGGHLALQTIINYKNMISGGILAYPVVSTDPAIIHQGSFDNLLGEHKKYLSEVSLENQITRKLPPIFIWHTIEDQTVKVENTYRVIDKLKMTLTKYESIIYPNGPHGLSLGTQEVSFAEMDPLVFDQKYKDIQNWINQAINFIKNI